MSARRLRVTIDIPDYFVGPNDTRSVTMSSEAVVTFVGAEGDSPGASLRSLTGTLVKVEVAE